MVAKMVQTVVNFGGAPMPNRRPQRTPQSLGSRILSLLFLVRSSGFQTYRRELAIKETELRIVSVLGRLGPLTHVQLVTLSGHGKPQVSRATRELIASKLVSHQSHRAPFELTEKGEAVYAKLAQIAAERGARIVSGMNDSDLEFLSDAVSQLMRLGETWLAQEQRLAGDILDLQEEPNIATASGDEGLADGLISSLVTMSVLMQRSAFLLWRRTTGITPFNWIILSRVTEAGQMRMSELTYQTARDKSQVWRTVKRLIEDGLLERIEEPRRREIEIAPTAKGADIYQVTAEFSERRDRMIAAELGQINRARFDYLIERMLVNIQDMMGRDG